MTEVINVIICEDFVSKIYFACLTTHCIKKADATPYPVDPMGPYFGNTLYASDGEKQHFLIMFEFCHKIHMTFVNLKKIYFPGQKRLSSQS